jgi:GT2 family glycosyltransferase
MIYIAIPVHNRKNLLRNCLLSLRNQTNKDFKIIVTDDGSNDGTGEMLRSEFPEITVLQGDGNLWWTGSINEAVSYALERCDDDDFILVLNDDLEVPENYIEDFYILASKHPNTLIGSVVTDIDDKDRIYSGGVKINWFTGKTRGINNDKSLSSFGKGYYTDEASYLTGRGVLISSKVFKQLGIYNNNHYTQCGDTELPIRARKAGYKLIVSYDVPVYSYVKDEGHINHLDKYSFRSLKKYYFDIRSHVNLRERFWFAIDSTSNIVHGLWFFVMDFTRITVHFFRRF